MKFDLVDVLNHHWCQYSVLLMVIYRANLHIYSTNHILSPVKSLSALRRINHITLYQNTDPIIETDRLNAYNSWTGYRHRWSTRSTLSPLALLPTGKAGGCPSMKPVYWVAVEVVNEVLILTQPRILSAYSTCAVWWLETQPLLFGGEL